MTFYKKRKKTCRSSFYHMNQKYELDAPHFGLRLPANAYSLIALASCCSRTFQTVIHFYAKQVHIARYIFITMFFFSQTYYSQPKFNRMIHFVFWLNTLVYKIKGIFTFCQLPLELNEIF